jgi:hypothetical protein
MKESASMRRTGVFLPQEEVDAVIKAYEEASATPVINFGGPDSPDLASLAWERQKKLLHGFALAAGLPEIPGYYGLDTGTHEVLES